MTDSEMNKSKLETALYTNTIGYGDKEIYSWEGRGATVLALALLSLGQHRICAWQHQHASTFNFPVRYESLGDIDPMWVVAAEPHPEVIKRTLEAAKNLRWLDAGQS